MRPIILPALDRGDESNCWKPYVSLNRPIKLISALSDENLCCKLQHRDDTMKSTEPKVYDHISS